MAETESNTIQDKAKRSTTITIISMFYLIVGFATAVVNTLSIALHLYGYAAHGSQEPFSNLLLLIMGMFFGIIGVVAGIGLWKLKRWAYRTAIVISGLLILIDLFAFFTAVSRGQSSTSYVAVIFHGLALVGLFSKRVKAIFTSS